jgi:uncharacterized protein YdhG (YjbR/CyaY superfamily)
LEKTKYSNIDEYIKTFPPSVREVLQKIRQMIKEAAPQAEETISYNMPAFKTKRVLVYFAAFENHIGFFPTPSGIEAFKEELSGYKLSKGTVQFPLNGTVPYELIRKIVLFRVQEVSQQAASMENLKNKN